MEAVIKIVLILLAVSSVVVIVDIHWAVMDLTAMVSYLYMQKDCSMKSLLSDVNECDEGTSGCNQTCTNTNSSYICSCYNGYVLDSDGHSCNGKVIVHITYVITASSANLYNNASILSLFIYKTSVINVMRVHQAVIKPVLILMVVILVHAMMAMSLMLMVTVVMVRFI